MTQRIGSIHHQPVELFILARISGSGLGWDQHQNDGGATISRDPTSGHRYSFNNATGESIWLDEEEIPADDGEGGEVSGNGIDGEALMAKAKAAIAEHSSQ